MMASVFAFGNGVSVPPDVVAARKRNQDFMQFANDIVTENNVLTTRLLVVRQQHEAALRQLVVKTAEAEEVHKDCGRAAAQRDEALEKLHALTLDPERAMTLDDASLRRVRANAAQLMQVVDDERERRFRALEIGRDTCGSACSLCEDVVVARRMALVPCGHSMCKACFDKLQGSANTACPWCRSPVERGITLWSS